MTNELTNLLSLDLTKPLCFFDLEATGVSTNEDRIIEIYIKKINIDKSIQEYHTYVNPDGRKC